MKGNLPAHKIVLFGHGSSENQVNLNTDKLWPLLKDSSLVRLLIYTY